METIKITENKKEDYDKKILESKKMLSDLSKILNSKKLIGIGFVIFTDMEDKGKELFGNSTLTTEQLISFIKNLDKFNNNLKKTVIKTIKKMD